MKYMSEIIHEPGIFSDPLTLKGSPQLPSGKKRVHLLAMGDVGATLLMGLKLLGGSQVHSIGIYDLNPSLLLRYEQEMNQMHYPFQSDLFPQVEVLAEEDLFQCDVFVFCASKATPKVEDQVTDIRMSQYLANKPIVEHFASVASQENFKGLFAVVSDPVDPLCKAALLGSDLKSCQIHGYGLGVMNSRGVYYAQKHPRFQSFLTEGRSFGPHGEDLVIANSITNYDHQLSLELTKLAVESNLRTRELGYKPFMAPAISSGAISILETISGEWHYSSNYLESEGKGAFLGAKNRIRQGYVEIENLLLPDQLYERIKRAYDNLTHL